MVSIVTKVIVSITCLDIPEMGQEAYSELEQVGIDCQLHDVEYYDWYKGEMAEDYPHLDAFLSSLDVPDNFILKGRW